MNVSHKELRGCLFPFLLLQMLMSSRQVQDIPGILLGPLYLPGLMVFAERPWLSHFIFLHSLTPLPAFQGIEHKTSGNKNMPVLGSVFSG